MKKLFSELPAKDVIVDWHLDQHLGLPEVGSKSLTEVPIIMQLVDSVHSPIRLETEIAMRKYVSHEGPRL